MLGKYLSNKFVYFPGLLLWTRVRTPCTEVPDSAHQVGVRRGNLEIAKKKKKKKKQTKKNRMCREKKIKRIEVKI
jgi:hypothetical protein